MNNSVLAAAARTALRAPSVFNTQPWRWVVTGDSLDLYADPARKLETVDPDGRLLTLSCGAALHHARVALAAAGVAATVTRHPAPGVLARITVTGGTAPADRAAPLVAAIDRRRTDRRAFGPRPVSETVLDELREAVEAEGCYLHVVRPDQIAMLAISTELAAGAESDDPDYRAELERWTNRTDGSGDGVPATNAVRQGLRRVPVRDFAPGGDAGLDVGGGRDEGAAYVVVFGTGDEPADLLRGGEALSALLLHATAAGLATEPITDAVEVTWPHHLLRGLLAGTGEPYVVVRLGYPDRADEVPATPRRPAADVIS